MSEDFLTQLAGFQPGSLVAGYRLEALVRPGGMAVVFRARDERLGRPVALKILAPALASDQEFRDRFMAEAPAAAAVDDPHIIPVYEAGEADGVLFIAMRFVVGGDLRQVLAREGALPPGRAAEFLSPVASALDAAHRAGLVHRDVKPANILVDAREDRPDHVYLSDFGVSKGAVRLTKTGVFVGTPGYAAPEQFEDEPVDGRTDQYALACVAFELLTGSLPFERDTYSAMKFAHVHEPPPPLSSRRPGLPGAADQVLAKGLAKGKEDRYGSCRDFADSLRDALGLAPYHPRGSASAPDRPRTQIASPPPEFPGVAAAAAGTAAVPAYPAAAASPSATATIVPPVPETAPSTAGHTDAEPGAGPATPPGDGERRATLPPRDDHPRAAARGPGPGLREKTPPASRPRRAGRASRRRPVITAIIAMGIVVVGLVIAVTTISGPPSTSISGPPGGSVRWTYTTGDIVNSSPAVAGGTVYIGSHDHKVYALDAATGRLRWTYTTGDIVSSSPVVAGGTVYVGSWDHKVYALDAATGRLRWAYTIRGGVSDPVVAGGTVYVSSENGWDNKVYALDAATGRLRWAYTTGNIVSDPVVAGGTVYVGSDDDKVYALDAATGQLRWTYTTGNPGSNIVSGLAVAGGTVYIGSHDHKVYALDAATGRLRWTYTTGDIVSSSPAVAGGTVYVIGWDDKVYALDAATGHLRWTYTTGNPVNIVGTGLAVAGGTVYVSGWDHKVYALDAATGQLRWTYTTGGAVFRPAVSGGTVYVGSWDDHKVYALTAGS